MGAAGTKPRDGGAAEAAGAAPDGRERPARLLMAETARASLLDEEEERELVEELEQSLKTGSASFGRWLTGGA